MKSTSRRELVLLHCPEQAVLLDETRVSPARPALVTLREVPYWLPAVTPKVFDANAPRQKRDSRGCERQEVVGQNGNAGTPRQKLEKVVIRFAGDSGDGMQLTGDRFTSEAALFGNDLATQPNYPAEIRAPQGTLPGVSSFQ